MGENFSDRKLIENFILVFLSHWQPEWTDGRAGGVGSKKTSVRVPSLRYLRQLFLKFGEIGKFCAAASVDSSIGQIGFINFQIPEVIRSTRRSLPISPTKAARNF